MAPARGFVRVPFNFWLTEILETKGKITSGVTYLPALYAKAEDNNSNR